MTIIVDRTTIDSKVSNEFLEAPFLLFKEYKEVMNRLNANNQTGPTNSDKYPVFFDKYKTILYAIQQKGKIEETVKGDALESMIHGYIAPVIDGINKKLKGHISEEDLKTLRYKAYMDACLAYFLGTKEYKPHTEKASKAKNLIAWFGAITTAALAYVTIGYFFVRQDMQNMYDENLAKVQLEIETAKKEVRDEIAKGKQDMNESINRGLKSLDEIMEQRIDEGVKKVEEATSLNPLNIFRNKEKRKD